MKNKYIVRENSSGKTRELLEFAKKNNLAVVCRDEAAMERKAQAYGIYGLKFCSYEDFASISFSKENHYGAIEEDYVIDEIENLMNYTTNGRCRGFTQTVE